MASFVYFFVFLFSLKLTGAENVDFSNCDLNSSPLICYEYIVIDDCNNEGNLYGTISTPIDVQPGKYKVTIASCPKTVIRITLTDKDFSLGPSTNSFAVGDGLETDSNQIWPRLIGSGSNDANELPCEQSSFQYSSSANSLWIVADLSDGNAYFKIRYDVILPNITTHGPYTENSGILTSSDPYPSGINRAIEEIHLIDVSEETGDYVDLLLTVHYMDLKGLYGDYIKLGPGIDPAVDKNTAVLSWRINKGIQFLIGGPQAHLVFQTSSIQQHSNCSVDKNSEITEGFKISYQVIEKNLTTPAPPTSPLPTNPTPLPFDPDILLTELVYYDYVTERARSDLVAVLLMYTESSGMLNGGQITPDLSEDSIEIVTLVNCYHGWNVDPKTCGQVQVIVRAFYNKSDEEALSYAFPEETVKAAIRKHGNTHGITLPEDLVNLYWITFGVILVIILFIIIGLLFCWKQKLRRDITKRSKYQELPGNQMSSSIGSDIIKGANNPNFVIDEEDINGRPVMTYDPEKVSYYLRNNERTYSTPPTIQLRAPEPEPERTAVLNITPITSSFDQWQIPKEAVFINDAKQFDEMQMSSIMLPLTAVPKRGILKTNSNASPTALEFPTSFPIPTEDLYDSNTLGSVQQNHYSSSSSSDTINSSSQSSRTNSISTDQQINSQVFILEDNIYSDGENETNL